MALQAENMADVLLHTQEELRKGTLIDIVQNLVDYPTWTYIINNSSRVCRISGGEQVMWNLVVKSNDAAKFVGIHETDELQQTDLLVRASLPWKHITTNYLVSTQITAMNSGSNQVVDYVRLQRDDALYSFVSKLEDAFWTAPTGALDDKVLHGVPYWVVMNAVDGFTGGAPAGFTTVAGISPSTYEKWRNFNKTYADYTKPDFIAGWREAADKTRFVSVVPREGHQGEDQLHGFFSTYTVKAAAEALLTLQNDNLGMDLTYGNGKAIFRGIPLTWVPVLDSHSYAPLYGLSFRDIEVNILEGLWLKESNLREMDRQHTTLVSHIDGSLNVSCQNRRSSFVLHTAL